MSVAITRSPINVDIVGRASTAEERRPLRDLVASDGARGIDEGIYAAAFLLVDKGWQVTGEVHTGYAVTWYVIPLFSVREDDRLRFRDELYLIANKPPYPAVTVDNYRINLTSNC